MTETATQTATAEAQGPPPLTAFWSSASWSTARGLGGGYHCSNRINLELLMQERQGILQDEGGNGVAIDMNNVIDGIGLLLADQRREEEGAVPESVILDLKSQAEAARKKADELKAVSDEAQAKAAPLLKEAKRLKTGADTTAAQAKKASGEEAEQLKAQAKALAAEAEAADALARPAEKEARGAAFDAQLAESDAVRKEEVAEKCGVMGVLIRIPSAAHAAVRYFTEAGGQYTAEV